jgi:hypothetical protein
MKTDKAPANSDIRWMLEGGDTGRIGVERRSYLQLWITHIEAGCRL